MKGGPENTSHHLPPGATYDGGVQRAHFTSLQGATYEGVPWEHISAAPFRGVTCDGWSGEHMLTPRRGAIYDGGPGEHS